MKARVYQSPSGLYWGQVWNEEQRKWEDATMSCLTEWGAKRELKKWKKEHCPDEFEI